MARPKPWRVRVRRYIDDVVEVQANTAAEAVAAAAQMAGVVSVYAKSAFQGTPETERAPPLGVEE